MAVGCVLGTARAESSTQILLPTIVVGAHGAFDSVWGTEVRAINRSEASKELRVVDWIGTPGWKPSSYTVASRSILSIGGLEIYGGSYSPDAAPVGLAVCEIDEDLIVQTAVLGGPTYASLRPFGDPSCARFNGGGAASLAPCSPFAGPIVEGVSSLFPANQMFFVPWLHTISDRRTNLVLFNGDANVSHVTVTITSADDGLAESQDFDVPARGLLQVNDLFSKEPWADIRVANSHLHTGAASATITGDTRLYAVAYVISSYNNSLTISLPR